MVAAVLTALLFAWLTVPVAAQTPAPAGSPIVSDQSPKPTDWATLREQREELIRQINATGRQAALAPHPNALSVVEASLRNAEAELKRLRDQRRSAPEIQAQDDIVQALKDKVTQAKAADDQRKKAEDQLVTYREQLARLDARIGALLTPEILNQNFKFWMSGTFAMLVLFVILGFFVLAWRDEAVRRAIFAGAAGIQFVTLFSLVIAIILFGITGILEGKELAALLGGLSGYILGRGTGTQSQPPGGGG